MGCTNCSSSFHTYYQEALPSFFQSSCTFGVTCSIPQIVLLVECTGAILNPGSVLVLHIIEDLNFVLSRWPDSEPIPLQAWIEQVITQKSFPVKRCKSSALGMIEKKILPFIGWLWDLELGIIRSESDKVLAAAESVCCITQGSREVQHM